MCIPAEDLQQGVTAFDLTKYNLMNTRLMWSQCIGYKKGKVLFVLLLNSN